MFEGSPPFRPRVVGAPLALMLLALLSACDPCTGVAQCSAGAYLAAGGQVVDASQGGGLDGVRIDVVRTGGIDVDPDSLSTVTSGGGHWRVEFSPGSPGALDVDFIVSPPGTEPYRLRRVQLVTRQHAGDTNLNERWVPALFFEFFGEFFLEGTADQRVPGATVEFRRTGGLPWSGPRVQNDVWRDTTDQVGRVRLFPNQGDNAVFVGEDGVLVGDLTVRLKDGSGQLALRDLRMSPRHTFRGPHEFPPILRAAIAASSVPGPAPLGAAVP